MKNNSRNWWWLSFVDPGLPEGQRFLGVAIVKGQDIEEAAWVAHALGINPGGEVRGLELPNTPKLLPEWTNRLLNRTDCEEFDRAHTRKS